MKRAREYVGWLVAGVLVFAATPAATYASDLITGKDVKNGSLTGKDIANNSLSSRDIRNRSVKGRDIAPGAVHRSDLAEGVKPPRTRVFKASDYNRPPNGSEDDWSFPAYGIARDVAPYTLVEAIDLFVGASPDRCPNGYGELKLGDQVIGTYTIVDGVVSETLGSGDSGSESKRLVFRFECDSPGGGLAGQRVDITYQLTKRSLDDMVVYR